MLKSYLLIWLSIYTNALLTRRRLLSNYSYPPVAFSPSNTYLFGDIVFVGEFRYFCFDQGRCSGDANSPGTSEGWKALKDGEAVDLSQDTYQRDFDYSAGDSVVLHQKNFKCESDTLCDSDQNNPVGINGPSAWTFVSINLSTLSPK